MTADFKQVGPLYWGVVKPGETWYHSTGAVWFTLKAKIVLDRKETTCIRDAIIPIGIVVTTVVVAAVTAGVAAGPAAATMTGAAGASAASAAANTAVASTLVGAGMTAGTSLTIATGVNAGIITATTAATTAGLRDIFKKENMQVSKMGCYAGPPWPFTKELKTIKVSGGPTITQIKNHNGEIESVLQGGELMLHNA